MIQMNKRNPILTTLFFGISLIIASPLFAQQENIRFEHFTQDHGLSAPVTKIAQDHFGFLWLGTTDGLNRFDGKNFIVYRNIAGDTHSLVNNIINDLNVDSQGRVWVATNGGLCYYHFSDDAFHAITFNDTLEKIDRHRVHAVVDAKDGGIWFATKTILHYWREHQPVESHVISRATDFTIKCLYVDPNHHVWIGTNDHLFAINTDSKKLISTKITSLFSRETKLRVTIHPIIPYQKDTLLIGSWFGGVHKIFLSGDSIQSISLPDELETHPRKHVVKGMCRDQSGAYWVGTYGNGLSILEAPSATFTGHYHHDPADPKSLSSEYVYDVFIDASGILWIGTEEGLDKFDPLTQQFKSIPIPSPSTGFSVYQLPGFMVEDIHDPQWLWITVSGLGLFQYNASTRQFNHYYNDPKQPGSLPDNTLFTLYQDDQGRNWVGTKSGLCLLDTRQNKFTPVTFPGQMMPLSVHKIIQDQQKNFWFATYSSGVYYYNELEKTMIHYAYDETNPNSLPDNRVFCMMADHDGHIWIGTQNRGLCRLDPLTGKFIFFKHTKSDLGTIPDNGIYDLWEDANHHLWIATENGLAEMDLNDFSIRIYTTKDGLCNNDIFSIMPDHQGYFWFATNNGLSRFDPVKKTFKNYFMHDGLPTNSISGALYSSSDGTLYFGTSGMITYCQPGFMKMNKRIPPVVITNFKIFDKQVPVMRKDEMLQPIHLSYRENMITFDFAALNFTNSLLNQYAYKLEGFDDQWIYCGYKQSATFTNLDGGSYTFRVKAANNDGTWNEEGTYATVIVHPPYWKTWWFYLLCALVVTGILYIIYRFRINQLLKLQQIRLRISRDLHDDIGSTLSSINMISSMATQTHPEEKKAGDLFKTISTASRQAMELMSDIVWSINPKNDRMEMILIRMRQYASEILEAAHISFSIDMDEASQQVVLPVEKRKDFYLIFKEAINNLAKYSRAKHASIHIELKHRMLVLLVSDDGIGFDPAQPYSGNGLKNMKARAVQIHGDLSFESKPGDGVRISLKIPVTP